MGEPVFELAQVSRQFGDVMALSDLSLSIGLGERVALIGPSGAGKSTLLNLLNGSLVPSTGQVTVLGRDLSQLSPRRRRRIQRQVGTVYQQHHLVTNLSVIHNVNAGQLGHWSLGKAAWSLLWPQSKETVVQALEQVGIADKLYARADRLSGGEQQRVALARVLVQQPVAILADEPIASLDPARSHDLMALLRSLTREAGKTLVVSLHDIEFAFQYCTRLLGLCQGQLQFDLPPSQVTEGMIDRLYRFTSSR
ncbi:Phosphate-import ATP-binding protein PhnC [Acaryochloris thomasi RCC1774]|uniref:Phosphate-import ATP-binding protein PhnC n=1 Tax=Acaryochloris thomasi RCC1774 TaxID=1764569 RepID=A0A2W1JEZ4_9CYAN|nr:ATP-binding cassette domain-containing protein [Acaryochloris thomasi]PZD70305.1 Phosphate-import ATP-binding protein PhnC [Acaryochloris thomasi RCC1774]